jgi:hypothetical protein
MAVLVALAAAGCGGTNHLAISHRLTPGREARIVVLPVKLPPEVVAAGAEDQDRTIASLYATQLLKAYQILEYERFVRDLQKRGIELDSILVNGIGEELTHELSIDGVLLSEVYSWQPGTPGFWFLAKDGRIGFLARLIDLKTGSVIWSANRVRETPPEDPLSVGLSFLFQDLIEEMPHELTPY